MFWNKSKEDKGSDRGQNQSQQNQQNQQSQQNQQKDQTQTKTATPLTLENLKQKLAKMDDAEIIEREPNADLKVTFIYIRTLVNQERLNESVIEPLNHWTHNSVFDTLSIAKIKSISTLEEALEQLLSGSVIIYDVFYEQWWTVHLDIALSRSIESSETETILYGPKDSFSEQIDQNITLIRRRLPITELKTESFNVGSMSKTTIVLMYIEGLTNPEIISIARDKLSSIDFDLFLESSNVAAFMEEHPHSIFPQFQQTDRPDVCVYSLGLGKLTLLVNNTPFALIAPITFFHHFQSPEDYIHRWIIASFLRTLRFISYFVSITLIPMYVALTTHHYQMMPMQILFVVMESRLNLPFTPFWEAFLILATLEIIKEASLRMPTKSGQTLGVIGGIVIGQAAVQAEFASKVLIVLAGIATIASFLVPNYLMTKSHAIIQFVFLVLSSFLGVLGIVIGMIAFLAHLSAITSLKQPYFAPLAPFHGRDWIDLFIRGHLPWMKTRPVYLHPLKKWRTSRRR